jgi:hypothetical protein
LILIIAVVLTSETCLSSRSACLLSQPRQKIAL